MDIVQIAAWVIVGLTVLSSVLAIYLLHRRTMLLDEYFEAHKEYLDALEDVLRSERS